MNAHGVLAKINYIINTETKWKFDPKYDTFNTEL
jgi:hypothetical protein